MEMLYLYYLKLFKEGTVAVSMKGGHIFSKILPIVTGLVSTLGTLAHSSSSVCTTSLVHPSTLPTLLLTVKV